VAFHYFKPPSRPSPTGEGGRIVQASFPPYGKQERGYITNGIYFKKQRTGNLIKIKYKNIST